MEDFANFLNKISFMLSFANKLKSINKYTDAYRILCIITLFIPYEITIGFFFLHKVH